jgi:hypothetical protein
MGLRRPVKEKQRKEGAEQQESQPKHHMLP